MPARPAGAVAESPAYKPVVSDEARRNSRYHFARERIRKIVDGWPPLSAEQREQLALLLHPGGSGE